MNKSASEEELCKHCLQIPNVMGQLLRILWKLYGIFVIMIHSPLTELLKSCMVVIIACCVATVIAILFCEEHFWWPPTENHNGPILSTTIFIQIEGLFIFSGNQTCNNTWKTILFSHAHLQLFFVDLATIQSGKHASMGWHCFKIIEWHTI